MQRMLSGLLLALLCAAPASAAGLLIPKDGGAPLDMVDHKVTVDIDEQVAVTRVEQTFRNPSDKQLEATYVFPVPKGAAVDKFAMWVNGKMVKGEMVKADDARSIYTDIVRRIQDPGLLEYMGNNLLRLRVFPVPAHGDQKVAVRFTSVNSLDAGLVEYVYPLKTDGKAARTLEQFTIDVCIKSHHSVQNVYSPTHPVTIEHKGDRVAHARFEQKQALLDKDFQLFYTAGKKDVGLTALLHRPDRGLPGHFLLLVSPRAELGKAQQLPRDMVFVLDTSGSMSGPKMEQARKALKFCIDRLSPEDRFSVLNFATTVGQFSDGLTHVDKGQLARARKWIDGLEAVGGTAIDAALKGALDLRPADTSRTFTVVFFTDGEPTVGETHPDKIVKAVTDRNTSHTRIFTFGVGNDVNATLLDRLADSTRAVSTYVRPEEDIEVKVSSLYAKISHPLLTDLKLTAGKGVQLQEVYPGQLPDLFHGGQVVVLGRYTGSGHKTITLSGKVGEQSREFVHEVNFPTHTGEERSFVEGLWARRKVGYLLDEIRRNGEKKELVDEVLKLARKHGITTPYTSYLVVPDGVTRTPPVATTGSPMPVDRINLPQGAPGVSAGSAPQMNNHGYQLYAMQPGVGGRIQYAPQFTGATPSAGGVAPQSATTGDRGGPAGPTYFVQGVPAGMPYTGGDTSVGNATAVGAPGMSGDLGVKGFPSVALQPPGLERLSRLDSDRTLAERIKQETASRTNNEQLQLRAALAQNNANTGKLAVDFAMQLNNLRNQNQLDGAPSRKALGRTCRQIGAAWVDEGFDSKMKTVTVKAMSKAYFRMLEKQPSLKEVFQLGNRVVWVAPGGMVLVVDPAGGKETMSDAAIDRLFARK